MNHFHLNLCKVMELCTSSCLHPHCVGLRLSASPRQCQVLCSNPKKANQYLLNVKHELTCLKCQTQGHLDEHAQAWLYLYYARGSTTFEQAK